MTGTTVRMFVNGQAMSGGSLHAALRDAAFLGRVRTASRYAFYAVRDEFPGVVAVTRNGRSVPGELYEVTYADLRDRLLPEEPSELELGVIELDDGTGCLSMVMRRGLDLSDYALISHEDGWLGHVSSLS